jgi:glucose-1-phosphate cytidylyltransferase
MRAVILAGGMGTRIAEESDYRPKPMIEVGGWPLLWHIMKTYSLGGINDFIICLGYKGHIIKEYFLDYPRYSSDLVIDMKRHDYTVLGSKTEDWKVTLVDTGLKTMTGGRLKRISHLLGQEAFCMTYGDGLADIDIAKEIAFHRSHGKAATVAAVQPPGRFGVLGINPAGSVESFEEKPSDEIGWINGGFFVLEPEVINYIEDDSTSWEKAPLTAIARDGKLMAYKHTGFWQPCDTLRDKRVLEDLWESGEAPWKRWKD